MWLDDELTWRDVCVALSIGIAVPLFLLLVVYIMTVVLQ